MQPDVSRGFHIFMDGNMWCAVGPHFRNLQEDKAGFADTPYVAYQAWWIANKNLAGWRGHSAPAFEKFIIHKIVHKEDWWQRNRVPPVASEHQKEYEALSSSIREWHPKYDVGDTVVIRPGTLGNM